MESEKGRFRIESVAGKGGMGTVYRAIDLRSGEPVALKLLDEQQTNERFEREATLLARLHHPGIVRYVAHGTLEGRGLYLAMEWLEGTPLDRRLELGPLTLDDALALAKSLARSLAAAHAAGVTHRDVKPSNVILRDGDPKNPVLVDFGIARQAKATQKLTATGTVIGTPSYMAPEQARGDRDVGARADVFSLGCVLYECLVGHPPFVGEHLIAVLAKILLEPAPRLRSVNPDIPHAVDALVASMLEKSPSARPVDAAAVADALERIDLSTPSDAPPSFSGRSAIGTSERRFTTVLLARVVEPARETADVAHAATEDALLGGLTRETEISDLGRELGVSIVAVSGGMFVGSLSMDQTGGEAALRMARCALALRERLGGTATAALATGRAIVVGEVPVGDAIDRAAALLVRVQRSDAAAVWIDEATAALVEERFELDGGEGARILVREKHEGRRVLGRVVPFVNRERELALLEATFRECRDEPVASATIVIAPPGTGKTRLQRELLTRISAGDEAPSVWLGLADPLMERAAFGLAADVFRRVLGLGDDEALDVRRAKITERVTKSVDAASRSFVATFLGELVSVRFDDTNDPALRAARRSPDLLASRIDDAVSAFVGAELKATGRPLVLVLEDVHWADGSSLRVFSSLLSRAADRPLLIVALARPTLDETHPKLWEDHRCERIVLSPLLRKAAERLARAVLGERPEVDTVVRRAAGNALFVEELARACARGHSPDELPATVAAATEGRLAALEAEARHVLRACAVFGERFWLGGVAALIAAPNASTETRLIQLEQQEVISRAAESRFSGEREYVFRHALVRDAAYAMLTDEDRRLGHALAAEWLEQRVDDAALLAHHFDLGGRREDAARWYVAAAEDALAANDFVGLAAHAARARSCGAIGPELGRVDTAEAEGAFWRNDFGAASAFARGAVDRLDRGSTRWFEAIGVAISSLGRDEKLDAARDLVRVLESVPATDEQTGRARAVARARAASALSFGRHASLVDQLLDGCEREPGAAGDPAVLAWLANAEVDRRAGTGRGLVPEIPARAKALYEQVGDRRSASVQAGMYTLTLVECGELDRAERETEDFLAEASSAKLPTRHLVYAQMIIRAWRAIIAGDIAPIVDAVKWADANVSPRAATAQRVLTAMLLAGASRFDAIGDLDALVTATVQAPLSHSIALSVQARACAASGDADKAVALATRALDEASAHGATHWGQSSIDLAPVLAYEAAGLRDAAARAAREGAARLRERAKTLGAYGPGHLRHGFDNPALLALEAKYSAGVTPVRA